MADAPKPPRTWMPLYVADYMGDTIGLTLAQHGAYLLTIMAYWRRGGPLPDAEARGVAQEHADTIARFFDCSEGIWRHGRIDAELVKAANMQAQRSDAGRASAVKRWGSRESNERYNSVVTESQRKNAPSPSPTQEQKEERGEDSLGRGEREGEATRADARSRRKGKEDGSARKGARLDAGWKPDASAVAYAQQRGFAPAEIEDHAANFLTYWTAGPGRNKTHADWKRAWQGWIRKERPKGLTSRQNGTHNGGTDTMATPLEQTKAGLEMVAKAVMGRKAWVADPSRRHLVEAAVKAGILTAADTAWMENANAN